MALHGLTEYLRETPELPVIQPDEVLHAAELWRAVDRALLQMLPRDSDLLVMSIMGADTSTLAEIVAESFPT